jgi:hypothetical protein
VYFFYIRDEQNIESGRLITTDILLTNMIRDLAQDRGPVEGSCEHGNEPTDSIKCWKVLE